MNEKPDSSKDLKEDVRYAKDLLEKEILVSI